MAEIGGYPILWHIMSGYAHFGYKDFVLALGYKGEMIKDFFLHVDDWHHDICIDYTTGTTEYTQPRKLDWRVDLVDTGESTDTGGRVRRLADRLRPHGTFMVTYGDGVSNVDIGALVDFHRRHGKLATVTAVRPPARFGAMTFDGDRVLQFSEKPQSGEGWINGGFFVFEPAVLDYLDDDATILERQPLERLVAEQQLMSYRHEGFWQCMDTLRDKNRLEELWLQQPAPWQDWPDKDTPQA